MGVYTEFKEFATRGNVVDMAVGIIIGGAFGTIVKSLVDDILMPPIGLLLGRVDFSNLFYTLKPGKTAAETLDQAKAVGAVTLNYGLFVNAAIKFLIVAFAMFLVVRTFNRLRDATAKPPAPAGPTTKDCPHCMMAIPLAANVCGHCTSKLMPV